MVAEGSKKPQRVKRSPINLFDREFIYTLPSGEKVTVSPHKGSRGLVTLPEGTAVEVRKIEHKKENK